VDTRATSIDFFGSICLSYYLPERAARLPVPGGSDRTLLGRSLSAKVKRHAKTVLEEQPHEDGVNDRRPALRGICFPTRQLTVVRGPPVQRLDRCICRCGVRPGRRRGARAGRPNRLAAEARARHHFTLTSRYEWMFWDAAWRLEKWSLS
jgi:hypothetical protein